MHVTTPLRLHCLTARRVARYCPLGRHLEPIVARRAGEDRPGRACPGAVPRSRSTEVLYKALFSHMVHSL